VVTNKKKLFAGMVLIFGVSATFSAVVTEGTQIRNNSSGRFPLVSLTMPALQEISNTNTMAKGCFSLLSNPTIGITREVEVMRNGQTVDSNFNSILSERAGKIIGCAVAIAVRTDEISNVLIRSRPNRSQAVKAIEANLKKNLESDYEIFMNSNQEIFNIPVLIAKGNNGYARDYMAFNDVVYKLKSEEKGGVETVTITDGGENLAKEKASMIRETIFNGVYSFSTNPMKVNSICSRNIQPIHKTKSKKVKEKIASSAFETYPCTEYFSVNFDGKTVDIRKSGQRWFDAEFIGGGVYAIELSGEKSTGTTMKVDQ
jgi:hypothetical protein